MSTGTTTGRASTWMSSPESRCSARSISSSRAPGGPASRGRSSRGASPRRPTAHFSSSGPRSGRPTPIPTSATCSTTVPRRRGCATVSTLPRCASFRSSACRPRATSASCRCSRRRSADPTARRSSPAATSAAGLFSSVRAPNNCNTGVAYYRGPRYNTQHYRCISRNPTLEVTMRRVIAVTIGLLFSLTASAQDKTTPLPRDLEIQLALSALPPHLRDNATVYVLNPAKGFEVARQGTNGFQAFVARTGDDAFRGSWPLREYRDDILYPISFDNAGAKAQMRVFLDAAELQAKGTPPEELKRTIQDRYKTGYYKAPARAGISYMLSPVLRTYWNPEENDSVGTLNGPHVMYYAPNVSSEDIGAGKLAGMYPFVIMPGRHGYMIQFIGVTERAGVNKEYEEMLARLCKIKAVWCL